MTIGKTPFGVPVILTGEDTVVPLTGEYTGWVQVLCQDNPTLLDALEDDLRWGASQVSFRLDPEQDMLDWRADFTNLMTVNHFGQAVSVLAQVRHQMQMLEAHDG